MTQSALNSHPRRPGAFTLIELLTVIGIIVVIVGLTIPAIKSLSKSNDQSQSVNLVRSMITSARGIAISQHRMAGVVFFEESSLYSKPSNSSQTAMQLFVQAFDQSQFTSVPPDVTTVFVYGSTGRQYLPTGSKLATLTDISALAPAETGVRAVLFNANGDLVLVDHLYAPLPPGSPVAGSYADGSAYGDWHFDGTVNARSSPGFFVYNKSEYDAQLPANRAKWLKMNSGLVLVNANTGGVIK